MRSAPKQEGTKGSKQASRLIDAGVWLQLVGDVSGAHAVFRQALEFDPNNVRAQQLYSASETHLSPPPQPAPSNQAALAETPSTPSSPAIRPVSNDTIQVRPDEALAMQSSTSPAPVPSAPPLRSSLRLRELLREARIFQAQGRFDKAAGLVLQTLMLDAASLDALELAYQVMWELERPDAAAMALARFVTLCVQHGEVERAQMYAHALARFQVDGDETLPPFARS